MRDRSDSPSTIGQRTYGHTCTAPFSEISTLESFRSPRPINVFGLFVCVLLVWTALCVDSGLYTLYSSVVCAHYRSRRVPVRVGETLTRRTVRGPVGGFFHF